MWFFKLLPTKKYGDRVSYQALIKNEILPEVESKIPQAYQYFYKELSARLQAGKFEPNQLFIVAVTCLHVVFIDLDSRERPYDIFESLNYKGKPLTQADLVRNFIAMKLPEKVQTPVFDQYWSPIEEMLQEKRTVGRSRLGELTAFLRHYLTYITGALINKKHVYSRLRDRGASMNTEQFQDEVSTLKRFATYYDRFLRPDNEPNQAIAQQLKRLNVLEITTAYPFLLHLYDQASSAQITKEELLEGLKVLEVYLVRRWLAQEPSNYLNKMFPSLPSEVDMGDFIPSLKKVLTGKNMPTDTRLRQSAENVTMYTSRNRQKLTLVFDTLNRYLSAGSGAYTQLDDEATIEHIMPQTLTTEWKQSLGNNWAQDHELLHTLGNLTVVTQSWNSKLSNASYASKREQLNEHGLKINSDYFKNAPDHWNAETIRSRAYYLIEIALAVWPPLGEVPEKKKRETPRSLEILGETFTVKYWSEVLVVTAEQSIAFCNEKERLLEDNSTILQLEKFARSRCRQLRNGWWLCVQLSADATLRHCDELLKSAGIPDDEFSVEVR